MPLVILTLVVLLHVSVGVRLPMPFSRCPEVFRYESSRDFNEVYGVMTFENDHSGTYRVELNMSIPAFTNQNLVIRRVTTNSDVQAGADLMYYVSFPMSDHVPEVTSVVFNQHVYCVYNPAPGAGTFLTAFDFVSMPVSHQHMRMTIRSTTARPVFAFHKHQERVTVDYQRPASSHPPEEHVTYSSKAPTSTTTADTPTVILRNRYSEEFECGTVEDTQALVVHGTPTSESQYPWLVAMFHLVETGEYKFKCAGNLVSNEHVITAAHCVRKDKTENMPKANVILVMGKHNIRSWAVRSEIRDLKEIFVHPDYRRPSDGDLAILVMYKPVEFTEKIRPVCLWSETEETVVGSEGTVVGWGRDELFSQYVAQPREISMPIVSQEDCLRSDERFIKLTSNRTFCAGARNGSGVCTGDSGGGFVVKRKGRWILRGIVSAALVDTSTKSCDVNNYMVFSDVAKYKLWIDRVLAK